MKLVKVQATNFRSIEDSGEFEVGDLTCLVGKNEAGKTAVLRAIQGIRPTDSFEYDRTRDYPRRYLNKFDERHPDGESPVARTWWSLDDDDIAEIEATLGDDVLQSSQIEVTSYIGRSGNTWSVHIDQKKCLRNLEARSSMKAEDKLPIKDFTTTTDALSTLKALEEKTEPQQSLITILESFREGSAILAAIDILSKRMPRFFYTSHFERMSGELSLDKLAQDKKQNNISVGDQIFLDFLEYAGTTIEELRDAPKLEELIAQCEGASNDITDEIFEFWSQNEALAVDITLNDGRPDDPPPFNSGRVAKIRVENKNHRVTVPLSERSAGFVWFFSFLSQFKQLKKRAGKSIILLDEPGLTLHGKAQSDLLRYIENRILPDHQVIYSTHSPFMVPAQRLSDVRVVEDVVDYSDPRRPIVKGTKVSAVVYLQVMSQALQSRNRVYLDPRWAICPTGGLDKISSFASLFAGNNLNIVALCDYGKGDKSKIERLRQSQILTTEKVLTAADFTDKSESDIEDLFAPGFYCNLVNLAFNLNKKQQISPKSVADAEPNTERLVKQVEAACRTLPPETPEFGHFIPADWLLRHPDLLDGDTPEVNESLDRFEAAFKAINQFLS